MMGRKPSRTRRNVFALEALESKTLLSVAKVMQPIIAASIGPAQAGSADSHRVQAASARASGRFRGAVALDSTTVLVRFKTPLAVGETRPIRFDIDGLDVISVTKRNRSSVLLKTSPQSDRSYTLNLVNPKLKAAARAGSPQQGARLSIAATGTPVVTSSVVFAGVPWTDPAPANPAQSPDDSLPRVVGATSTSNTTVVVQFSEPMSDSALVAANYAIVQKNVNPEAGRLMVRGVAFLPYGPAGSGQVNRSAVKLTTDPQNGLTYGLTVVNVIDFAGQPMISRVGTAALSLDPNQAVFAGTPPAGATLVDTDGDGLSDNEEARGWTVRVIAADGKVIERQVTSDIYLADTDGDGLTDVEEAKLGIDPRSVDTDADQLSDWQEYNEIYSNPLAVDTDGDTLDDSLEFNFFKTSPVFADTDGDQLRDDAEIVGNRNPRVADLPRPEVEVGAINLQLDVRFSESNAKESRDLESRSVTATLAQSESKSLSRQYTGALEAHVEGGTSREEGQPFAEVSATAGFTFQQTEESASETARSYENSLAAEQEVTSGFTVDRQVVGAVMQATVNLRNASNLAYRIKNLQVTAFILDPLDRSKLTPVATLLPDNEPADGFAMGPLVTNRGPIIFSNSTIVPTLVESLMANSSGLVFRISNYDIVNEDGRNFAFVSQDVVERTAGVVIDFGGARSLRAQVSGEAIDENQPGDETEIHRVATSAGRTIDTNFDGKVDDSDRRATFDSAGKEVGIPLYDALAAIGLTRFEARYNATTKTYVEYLPGSSTPVDTSTASEETRILGSYATYVDSTGREKIFRIRGVTNDFVLQKYWEIMNPLGIDQATRLSDLILKTDSPVSLNFVQDADKDSLPADVEYLLRTSDSSVPVGVYQPDASDTVAETITFYSDPGFVTGTRVGVTADSGGLVATTEYYLRNLGGGVYSLFNTAANAKGTTTTGRINLVGAVTSGVFAVNKATAFSASANTVSFFADADYSARTLANGSRVQVATTGGGLTAGTDYFARFVSATSGIATYSFYNTSEAAKTGGSTGLVKITALPSGRFFDPTARGRDTDRDGLDDRFEALIGWTVSTPQSTITVYSSPNRADSNFDSPKAGVDSDSDGKEDRLEYDGSDFNAAPAGWIDKNSNGLRDRFEVYQVDATDLVLDPIRVDTDGDGLRDAKEIIGFQITRVDTGKRQLIAGTNPNSPFTDSDTFTDGFEAAVGLDPTNGNDTDEDGDGLPDLVEKAGWEVGKFLRNDVFNEVQTFTVAQASAFTVQFGVGVSTSLNTASMAANATDAALQTALNALSIVKDLGGSVTVTRTNPTTTTATYRITFGGGSFAGQDQSPLIVKTTTDVAVTTATQGDTVARYSLEGVSTTPLAAGPRTAKVVKSATDSADTDGDGLSDYEEFFLKTDPRSKDSDNDGIDDRTEFLGYTLGHKVGSLDLGIIKTDPLDADTDNDMRSDGDEAELVDIESKRWVVRATGSVNSGESASQSAYRVYSNPLVADADFDGLVDGEEFFGLASMPKQFRTDPNNANTDGDKRNDGDEARGGLNPLLEDFRVTVVAEWIQTFGDGTPIGTTGGDYQLDLGIRLPDESGPAGLSTSLTSAMSTRQNIWRVGPNGGGGTFDRYFFGDLLPDFSKRSLTFSVAAGQRFSIEMSVKEYSSATVYGQVDLGGLTGLQGYKTYDEGKVDPNDGTGGTRYTAKDPIRTIFSADSLTSGDPGAIHDLYFSYDTSFNNWKAVNGYRLSENLIGVVKLFYFIE